MKHLLLPALCLSALPALAQDAPSASEERDRGFIAGLIEDNLSSPGLQVRVDGFSGALSSEASLAALTVADEQGVWLRLEDVVLDWNRSALLRGRLEVEELSARLIRVERAPLPAEGVEALPDAGASTGFSLPDLPVSIDIQTLHADRIELGAALAGQDLALSLDANAQLSGGSGAATIRAQRLDDTTGTFSIAASYAAETQELSLDLDIDEAEGGLAANLLQLPGAPAIRLTVAGAGPLDAFTADIGIASDGTERLGGQVTLAGAEDGRRFDVDIGGDVTSLFAPRYQAFFGDEVALRVSGQRFDDGRLDLDALDVTTQALTLGGSVRLGTDGWPVFLDVTGRLASPDGTPVLLPVSSDATLRTGTLTVAYDAAVSDEVRLDLTALDYGTDAVALGDATVGIAGTITRDGGTVTAAAAAVEAALNQLVLTDPALAQAAGQRIGLTTDVAWTSGGPVRISDLALTGPDYGLNGNVEIASATETTPLTLTLDLNAALEDLSRLALVANLDALAGAADATVTGTYAPTAGGFDLALAAATQDLVTGIAQADGLLEGETTLALDARRTLEGTFLDRLDLSNAQMSANGSGAILTEDAPSRQNGETSRATFNARIADGTRIDPRLDGPITLAADVTQNAQGVWQGKVDATAPEGVTLSAEGDLTGDTPDVTFAAMVPRIAAFVEGVPGALDLSGRAFAADGIWSVDAQASGPWDVTATVAGPVTGPNPAIAFEASLPDLTAPVPALASQPALQGPATLAGTLTQTDGVWSVDTSVSAPAGIALRARGPVTGPGLDVDVTGTVPRVEDFVPAVQGRLDLEGNIARMGDDFAAEVTARGPYGAVVTAQTVVTRAPLRVGFTADIADLSQLAPVPGGLSVTGEAVQTPTGYSIDVDGTGPYAATLDATVILADGVPSVTATGRIPQASALVPQLEGPVDYRVSAEQVDGQFRVDATVDGAQGISATVSGIATGPAADLDFDLRVGNVAPFVPGLGGALDASGRAFQQDGDWNVDVDADGPLGATLQATGRVTGDVEVQFTLAVPDIGPLVPDIRGPLRVTGTARQQEGGYGIDVDLTGPSGTNAAVAGTVGADGRLDLGVTGSAPLGLANAALAPQRLSGVARFDLRADGPAGLDALSGTIFTSGAALSLPTLRNGLNGIDATVTLGGGRAQIQASAQPESGGRITVSGPVGLSAPFDANLAAQFAITAADPKLYTADVSGQIAITGPLAGGALIAGAISIDGAEIRVPSSGITAIGDLPDIRHLRTPRPVQRTLALAGQDAAAIAERAAADTASASGGGYGLNLRIDAPGRIFVRGRGLDAELGGTLTLTGTTSNPVTSGGFELIRGRLNLLEKRFDLTEGRIDFVGDLTPNIRLVATTQTDTITASIVVEGPADDITVRFESTPEVPQEEIVAQIFFGRDLSELSPLQAIQLANSVATLAGRGTGGLLEKLRGGTGLDDLDITTDDEGNAALRAGKYLTDNIYTDVQVDQNGKAALSLNLDVSRSLTVRGAVGSEGGTSLGLFFERDY